MFEDILKIIGCILLIFFILFIANFYDTHVVCFDYLTIDNEKGSFCLERFYEGSCTDFRGSMRCTYKNKAFLVKEYKEYYKEK